MDLGSLPHFRPARRDEGVHPPHSGAKPPPTPVSMTRNPFSVTSVILPMNRNHRADDAKETEADEQHGKGQWRHSELFSGALET